MPVRIVLSVDPLRVESIDEPEDGGGYGSSLARLMPAWAVNRLDQPDTDWDTQAVRDTAGAWAKRNGLLAQLISVQRPQHADPHHHVPDVYDLGVIRPSVSGFSVRTVQLSHAPRHPNISDFEREFASRDGRYIYYYPISGYWPGVVIHDLKAHRWLHVAGPGLDLDERQNFDWVGNTLVFDAVDVGFSRPRPRPMTMIHVEIDLEKPAIERVVPIGPYTGNWPPPK
jgi:hypothetical protein